MSARSTRAPAGGAGEQVVRILTLVPFLHAHGRVDVEQASQLLDVGPEQVVSDLKVLFMCGLPGGYPDDLIDVDIDALEGEGADGVIRVANADYLARPLRLTPTEASAMIVAVRALRCSAGPPTRPIVDRVLAKLETAAASGPAAALVDPGTDLDADRAARGAALADMLRRAVEQRRQVRLRYWVPARDEVSSRVVDPHAVVTHAGHDYLDAYCHGAEAPRLFRLDRVERAELLDTEVASAAPARDLPPGLLAPSSGSTRVTVRLRPEAAWVADYYPVEDVRPAAGWPPGTLLAAMPVADHRWLTRLLLRLAPHASVVEPVGATDEAVAAARLTLALYDETPPETGSDVAATP